MSMYDDTDRRQHRQVFGWYKDEGMIVDAFTYQTVTASYNGTPCRTIGKALVERAGFEKCKYMTICIPSYNEDKEEMYKTMLSLLQNTDFIKKARCSDTPMGLNVEQEFQKTIMILVPIFDGVRAMDESMKSWLSSNFRGVFDQLLYPEDQPPLPNGKKPEQNPQEIVVKAACRRWWFYTHDVVPTAASMHQQQQQQQVDQVGPDGQPLQAQPEGVELFEDHLIQFYMLPIVKKTNHRKHNSHQWFFDSVCLALDDTCTYAFLTDCGTTYERNCLAILFKELHVHQHLIGVTARQRVEWPNKYYHPCENSPWSYCKGDHTASKSKKPCWKCYVSFFLSPCPLQGFEFEASLITNLSMFNLVEALPVMPGPCQLMNWQKMKHFQIVKEYFNLLFKEEVNKKEKINVPARYHKMIDDSHDEDFSDYDSDEDSAHGLLGGPPDGNAWDEESKVSRRSLGSRRSQSRMGNMGEYAAVPGQVDEYGISMISNGDASVGGERSVAPPKPIPTPLSQTKDHGGGGHGHGGGPEKKLTFTEFLRTNMRLAEDRVLSFVGVFSTRYGTKWIPGATFYYTPEITWQTLLLQRRRWINGTLAAYFFFLLSRRAKTRLNARMFDDHNAAKVMVLFLWRMQLFQLLLVFIAPAVFGSMGYISLLDCAKRFPNQFWWANTPLFGDMVTGAHIFIITSYLIYVSWVIASYFIPGGRMPEYICQILAVVGFFYMIPVYWSLYSAIFMLGFGFVAILVFISLFSPAIISLAESAKCLQLYICYFPWFMTLIVFFLIFMPSYSFSRLFDTTWGNRATGSDSAVKNHEEETMKRWCLFFIIFLMASNFMITVVLQRAYKAGYNVIMAIMVLVFVPSVVQLVGAILFWIKTLFGRYFQRASVMGDIIQARAQLRATNQPPGSTASGDLSNGGRGMFAHGLDMGVSMYVQNPLRGPGQSPTAGSSSASVVSHAPSHVSHAPTMTQNDLESGRSIASSQAMSFRRVPSNPALTQTSYAEPPQSNCMWIPPLSPRDAAINQDVGYNHSSSTSVVSSISLSRTGSVNLSNAVLPPGYPGAGTTEDANALINHHKQRLLGGSATSSQRISMKMSAQGLGGSYTPDSGSPSNFRTSLSMGRPTSFQQPPQPQGMQQAPQPYQPPPQPQQQSQFAIPSPRHMYAASNAPVMPGSPASSVHSNGNGGGPTSAPVVPPGGTATGPHFAQASVLPSSRSTSLPSPRTLNGGSNGSGSAFAPPQPFQQQAVLNVAEVEPQVPGAFPSSSPPIVKKLNDSEPSNNSSGLLQSTPSVASVLEVDNSGLSSTIHMSREYSPTTIHSNDNPMIVVQGYPHYSPRDDYDDEDSQVLEGSSGRHDGIAENSSYYSTDDGSNGGMFISPNRSGLSGAVSVATAESERSAASNRYPFGDGSSSSINPNGIAAVAPSAGSMKSSRHAPRILRTSTNDEDDEEILGVNQNGNKSVVSQFAVAALQSTQDSEDLFTQSRSPTISPPVAGLSALLPRNFNNGLPLAVQIPQPPLAVEFQQQSPNDETRDVMAPRSIPGTPPKTFSDKIEMFQRLGLQNLHAASMDEMHPGNRSSTRSNPNALGAGRSSDEISPLPSRAASLDFISLDKYGPKRNSHPPKSPSNNK